MVGFFVPRRRCARSALVHGHSFVAVAASQVDQERVSLSTPEDRFCVRIDSRKKKLWLSKEKGSTRDKPGEDFRASQKTVEGEESKRLPKKIIECGKAIGVSVEPNAEGCGDLVNFAIAREEIRNGSVVGKSKKKGGREIQNLRCSNYCENSKECEVEGQKVRRSGRRKKGEFSSFK